MECPHLIIDCKINRELVKTKKSQLIDKCNTTGTAPIIATTTISQNTGNVEEIKVTKSVSAATTTQSAVSNSQQKGWKCGVDECESKNNWMCLTCGMTLCGRYEKGHALDHFNKLDHKICMSVLDFSVYCYKCDNFVVNSTPQLDEIRQYLRTEDDTKSETSSNTEESVSLSGSSVKSSSNNSNASISSNDSGWEEPLHMDTGRRLRPRKRTNSNDSSVENSINKGRKIQRKSMKDDNSNTTAAGSTTGALPQSKKRFVGLRNLGNTCFMNSVLHSLSTIQEFSCYISSLPSLEKEGTNSNSNSNVTKLKQRVYHSRSMKENYDDAMILKDLRRLLIDLGKGSNGKAITPEYLLRWNFPQFNMNQQNDAHEFLRYMLDRLHTELQHLPNNIELNNLNSNSIATNSKPNSNKDSNNGCTNTGDNTNKNSNNSNSSAGNNSNFNNTTNSGIQNYRGSKSSIVTNVFGGILQNEVRCLICGMESKKNDPFLDLSLDIPEKFCKDCSSSTNDDNSKSSKENNSTCNIKDCLSSFMEVEELDIEELYYCTSCKCKQKSTKRFSIRRLPNVLCLHIKRFRWNPQRIPYEWSKIDLKISFPIKALDMSQYVLSSGPETRRNSQISNIYDLGAVIVHHGHGKLANVGHYTAYAINNGTWLHFDDHTVKEVLSSEVAECKPYMLFYIRRDPTNINNSTSTSSSPLPISTPLVNQKLTLTTDCSTSDNIKECGSSLSVKSTTITNNATGNNNSTSNKTL